MTQDTNGATQASEANGRPGSGQARILYCNCTYAKVIAPDVKQEVLAALSSSGVGFEAVADLCEMSARQDPALARLASPGRTKIAACFPRALKWLFHSAGTPLPEEGVEVLNMREQSPEEIIAALLPKPAQDEDAEATA